MRLETYNRRLMKLSEQIAQLKEQMEICKKSNLNENIHYRWENLFNKYTKLTDKKIQLQKERWKFLNEEMNREF